MVLFVDLDDEETTGNSDHLQVDAISRHLEYSIHNGSTLEASASGEDRPNLNRNGFAAILSCYP